MSEQDSTRSPWGGRFKQKLDSVAQSYTRSLHLDRRLAPYDLRGSQVHARMLAQQGIISCEDRDSILQGLEQIEEEIDSGRFPFRDELEDIHMNIERRLQELIGEPGGRLHTGRSRNDQVALDLKLFCLDTASSWQAWLLELQSCLLARSRELRLELFPAWTHLQSAQPLSWAHYLLGYCEMFKRDFRRLGFYQELHSISPLGAGALAGSTLPLDPEQTALELGFGSSFSNSYDVVGDRDFVVELLQIGAQVMLHFSRLAEDFIYFSSTPVSWIELPDSLCTGSSMMPQKKNPDILELARGKAASVLGHVTAVSVLIKGLPSSYQRDLQQDKEHLFPAVDIVIETLQILPAVARDFQIDSVRTEAALSSGFLMATDLAEYLVSRGVTFRSAHEQVGRMVAYCSEQGLTLEQLSLEKIQEFAPGSDPAVREVLQPRGVLQRRVHKGSTGMESIDRQIRDWDDWIREHRDSAAFDDEKQDIGPSISSEGTDPGDHEMREGRAAKP